MSQLASLLMYQVERDMERLQNIAITFGRDSICDAVYIENMLKTVGEADLTPRQQKILARHWDNTEYRKKRKALESKFPSASPATINRYIRIARRYHLSGGL